MNSTSHGERQGRIERLCREGNRHASSGEYSEALACFLEAWELLPEPQEAQDAAAPVLAGFTRLLRERRDLAPGLRTLLSRGRRFAAVGARLKQNG